jgi:hypothetical protein
MRAKSRAEEPSSGTEGDDARESRAEEPSSDTEGRVIRHLVSTHAGVASTVAP